MKTKVILWALCWLMSSMVHAQQSSENTKSIYKIPKALLAGEGLDSIPQQDTTRTVFQKKVYDGEDIIIFMVAIGTGITNEFQGFPLEEFIYWINGKAVVEPDGAEPFPVYTGDYFVQAKGFNGKWNFVDIGGVHLELALIAKNRPGQEVRSPISQAMVLDRDLISGVTQPDNGQIYNGVEITVNLRTEPSELDEILQERMLHVLNGVLTVTTPDREVYQFFPGDFFVLPEGFEGAWSHSSLQQLRVLEVFKTRG